MNGAINVHQQRRNQMFIIKSTKTDAILGNDGEMRASMFYGPLGFSPKIYKTRARAERAIQGNYSWRKVAELDNNGCEVRAQ
jgi:hypothetical protein